MNLDEQMEKTSRRALMWPLVVLGGVIVFWIVFAWVAIHFIVKFW